MQARTIDDVIQLLDEIIAAAIIAHDRMGYFPALYRRVTVAVKTGIQNGAFENGERMERLDVEFANRYLVAHSAYKLGQPLTESWKITFEATRHRSPMLLQHLLLGMNAHINLDLGIAAAIIAPHDEIHGLKNDFFKINMVLASLVGECINEFGKIWPIITWANKTFDSKEDVLISYELDQARSSAWDTALAFAPLSETEWMNALTSHDKLVRDLGRKIFHPPIPLNWLAWWFSLTHWKTVPQTIEILNEKTAMMSLDIQAESNRPQRGT